MNSKYNLKKLLNKVDVQNIILHTLRQASHVGEKQFFTYNFHPPRPAPEAFSGSNISKKVLVLKLMLTKPSDLIWYVTTIYIVSSGFLTNPLVHKWPPNFNFV